MLVTVLFLSLLVGCSQNNKDLQKGLIAYSFRGGNEQFSVMNGVILISEEEEIFYGGDLKLLDQENFVNIASYSATFYTLVEGEKRTIMSNSALDQTGNSLNMNGDLGRMSGADCLLNNKIEILDDLIKNLWFELKTTDSSGEDDIYQIQLELTDITK